MSLKDAIAVVACVGVVLGIVYAAHRNSVREEQEAERAKIERYEGACKDTSWLLATTSGSPSEATCPNKRHHMRVQVATAPSNEEAAALVFCECERADAGAGPQ